MLPQCDLVVAAPSTSATVRMIGRKEIATLRPRPYVIVVSRRELVDEAALAEALRSRQITGAVVDCYAYEPLPPGHFYFDTPNLIMTPHMSGVYDGFTQAMVALIADNLRRLKAGQLLWNRVSVQRGY